MMVAMPTLVWRMDSKNMAAVRANTAPAGAAWRIVDQVSRSRCDAMATANSAATMSTRQNVSGRPGRSALTPMTPAVAQQRVAASTAPTPSPLRSRSLGASSTVDG